LLQRVIRGEINLLDPVEECNRFFRCLTPIGVVHREVAALQGNRRIRSAQEQIEKELHRVRTIPVGLHIDHTEATLTTVSDSILLVIVGFVSAVGGYDKVNSLTPTAGDIVEAQGLLTTIRTRSPKIVMNASILYRPI